MDDGSLLGQFDPETVGALPTQGEQPQQKPVSLLGQFDPETRGELPEETTAFGAARRAAVRSAAPALGGLAAAGAGAEVGAAAGAFGGPFAPITVPVGAFAGGVIGAIAGSATVNAAQNWALSKVPDSWKETIGQDDRQQRLDEGEHPIASFMGGLVPYALTMRPGAAPKVALPENATALQRVMSHPATARVFGGAAAGGMELGNEAVQGEPLDWQKVGIATGFGLVFNRPTKFGERITEIGAAPARAAISRVRPAPEPTLAQAGDVKVMGPGITEEVFLGSHQQSTPSELTAQDTARSEQAVIGEPEKPDLNAIARQMEPELFERYDALQERRDEFRRWIAEYHAPPEEHFAELAARKADLEAQLAAHVESQKGYAGGAEARRLRAQIRDVQRESDALEARRTAYQEGRAEETPELAQARKHLQDADYELRDLGREVAAAYRRADEHANGAPAEPVREPEAVKPVEAPPAAEPIAETPAEAPAAAPAEPAPEMAAPAPEAAPVVQDRAAMRDRIAADFSKRLVEAGRPQEEADAAGQLIAARFMSRGSWRTDISPEELYRREAPLVERGEEIVSRAAKEMAQSTKNKELFQKEKPVRLAGAGDVGKVETGKPVTFKFRHNTESATKLFGIPDKEAPYGRGLEPSGRYVSVAEENEPIGKAGPIIRGELTFENPLVIENDNLGWKQELSDRYGGKTGKELSKALIEDGYDGVITTDKDYISEVLDLTTFDESKALYQGYKGKIRVGAGRRSLITLMEDADASTVIHELGHDFLEQIRRDAMHAEAPDVLKDDLTTVLDWLKVSDPDRIKTKHHEQFARGFERYMSEGRAPNEGLASVFAKFKQWLLDIYQGLKGAGVKINDDIRGVFDRMLTEEPSRTVIAADRERQPTLADIHETDASLVEPHEAEPAMDRIIAETQRAIDDLPPNIKAELEAANAKIEPRPEGEPGEAPGATTAGEAGLGGGQRPEMGEVGGGAGALPGSRTRGENAGEVVGRGGEARREGEGVSGAAGRTPSDDAWAREQPLAAKPARSIGPDESPFTDKAGNIRIENLTTQEDVATAIRDAAQENDDFIGDRRGVVTDGQVMDLADALGMDAATLSKRKIGEAFNAEQVIAARKLLIQSATDVAAAMKKAATGTDEDVLAYAMAKDRHQMIQAQVAGITAEAGRALRAFRDISMGGEAQAADQFIRNATGKTLFQLKEEARLGATLETPEQVSKFINSARKPSFGRMILEEWINALISGLKSQATYSIGNTIMSLHAFGPETALAAAIGEARSRLGREGQTVRIGEVSAALKGAREGFAPAIKAAGSAAKTGLATLLPGEKARMTPFETANVMAPRGQLDEAYTFAQIMPDLFGAIRGMRDGVIASGALLKAGGIEGAPLISPSYTLRGEIPNIAVRGVDVLPIGEAARLPSRMNAVLDSFFRSMNYSMQKNALAYRQAANEGLEGKALDARIAELRANPTLEMMESSRSEAGALTLMSKGGEFTEAVMRLTNIEVSGVPILKFIAPFVRVASNTIEETVIKRTPAGLFSQEIRADLAGKNGTIAQDRTLAKMLAGTALSITFGGLAAEGYLSGSGPKDNKEAAIWRLAGNQAHSVRIGDMWYDIRSLGPLAMLAGISADLYDVAHVAKDGELEEAAAKLHHAFMQNILDQSFMKGPADLIKAVENPDRFGQTYIRNFLSSFVPYSVGMGQIARSIDPYSREARTVTDAMKAKIPGLSMELLPKRDIWGELMPNRESALGVTTLYGTKVNADPVNQALLELGVYPAKVKRTIRNVELSDNQYDDYARISGRMTKMRLDAIINSPDWRTWPPHIREKVVQETVRQSREAASGVMMMKYPEIVRQAVDARIAEARGE